MEKNNKDRLIVILIICISIALFFTIKATIEYIVINRDHISNKIWIAFDNQMTQARLEDVGGEYVSDDFLGTSLEIRHFKEKSELVYYTEEKTIVILGDVIISMGNVQDGYPDYYIVASDGYGVITDSGEAVILLKSGEEKVFDESIKYIDSFEEFSENQQEMLIKLSK